MNDRKARYLLLVSVSLLTHQCQGSMQQVKFPNLEVAMLSRLDLGYSLIRATFRFYDTRGKRSTVESHWWPCLSYGQISRHFDHQFHMSNPQQVPWAKEEICLA